MSDDIFEAVKQNDLLQISDLIEREPELARARNQNGVSVLMQSVYENKPEITKRLRSVVGDLDLYEAAALGDVARLQTLLAANAAQANSRSRDGFSALHLACFFRQPEAAQVLLAAGADAKAVSAHRIAVIHSASASRDAGLVQLVLAAGADPNVKQNGGYTALQSARRTWWNYFECDSQSLRFSDFTGDRSGRVHPQNSCADHDGAGQQQHAQDIGVQHGIAEQDSDQAEGRAGRTEGEVQSFLGTARVAQQDQ
jgi:ankyrin repeat protein